MQTQELNDQKVESISKKIENLTLELSIKAEENNLIVQENKELKNKIADLQNLYETYQANENDNDTRVKEISNEVDDLKQQLENTRSILDSRNSEFEQLNYKINELNSLQNIESETRESFENKIRELEDLKANLEMEIENKNEIIADLQLKNSFPQNQNGEDHSQEIEELKQELEKYSFVKENFNTLIEEKNSVIDEQGKRLTQVKLERTEREIEFIKLKEQLEDLKNQIEKLNEAKNHFKSEASKKSEELQLLEKRLEVFNNSSFDKDAVEERLNSIIENQVEKIAELSNRIHDLENKNLQEPEKPKANIANENRQTFIETKIEHELNKNQTTEDHFESFIEDIKEEKPAFSFGNLNEEKDDIIDFESTENNSIIDDEIILENEKKAAKNDLFSADLIKSEIDLPNYSQFSHLLYGDVSVVTLNIPRATMEIAAKFKDYLSSLFKSNNSKIVIDLAECEFVDSTVLGVMVSSLKKAMSLGGDLRIVWGDNTESSMFYITRMDKVFKLYDNLESAIQSYLA